MTITIDDFFNTKAEGILEFAKVIPNEEGEYFQPITSPERFERTDPQGREYLSYKVIVRDLRDDKMKTWVFGNALFNKVADTLRHTLESTGETHTTLSANGVLAIKATQKDSPLSRAYSVEFLDKRKDYGDTEAGRIMRRAFAPEHICLFHFSNGSSICDICNKEENI